MSNLDRILRLMTEKKASDLFLSANMPVLLKLHGQMVQLTHESLTPQQPRQLLTEVLSATQLEELDDTGELNVSISVPDVAAFRVSAFKQRGTTAAVLRFIPGDIPPLDSLRLPEILATVALAKRGLVLMVGATGSGKSTTLAAMLDHRNAEVPGHILTLEDPIEYHFTNKKCVVNQREIGRDVQSLQIGLRNALRQAPDVLLIGEIRDRETMTAALSYALSGHLVVATLHANNSVHALGRILSFYTPEARPALLGDLSAGLRAVVSQRLVRSTRGGRVPACEVLLNTQLVQELIDAGNLNGVREAMERSLAEGSQTFEEDLARLITLGLVTRDEGLAHADSPSNLLWRLQNDEKQSKLQSTRTAPEPTGPSFTEITLDVHAKGNPTGLKPRVPGRKPNE